MSIPEFNSDFLQPLLTKFDFENKEVILLGDYNINLINTDSDKNTCEFLNLMLSSSFLPRITKPTRITPRSQTLIDNIFYNEIKTNIIAGNIITDISDHLTQFVSVPFEDSSHLINPKEELYLRNFIKLNSNNFKQDFDNINWDNLLSGNNIDNIYVFLGSIITY